MSFTIRPEKAQESIDMLRKELDALGKMSTEDRAWALARAMFMAGVVVDSGQDYQDLIQILHGIISDNITVHTHTIRTPSGKKGMS